MRSRLAALAAMVLITGAGLTAPAAAAADECLVTPGIITDDNYFEPVITNVPLQVPVGIRLSGDWYHCDGMTADVQKADGTLATTLKLDQVGGTGHPPTMTWFAWLSAPVSTGAGDWVITKVTHGANTLTTRVPFRLIRGSVLTIDPPPRTVGAARTPVTGLLRHYTSTGALARTASATIKVMHDNGTTLVASARSGSTGRYTVQVPFTRTTTMYATTPMTSTYGAATSGKATARKALLMSSLTAASTAYVNAYWKVSGSAFPGKLWTTLDFWNGSAWQPTQSFGLTAADGSYARYWKPTRTGTFRLRVTVSGEPLDNSPWSREVSVTVRQLPQQPTYLDGVVAPTAGPPVKFQTMMSIYGHLRIRRTDGTLGPLANEAVEVLAKRPADATWSSVGGSRTTSSGYYYTNWWVPFQAGDTFSVMVRYTTALPRAASTSRALGGPFTVQ